MRGQNVAPMLRQARENLRHLQRSLALSEDHFGHARAQGAMMVDFGETQIFERQMTQAVDRLVAWELAPAPLLAERTDRFGVHGSSRRTAFRQVVSICIGRWDCAAVR